MGCRCEVTASGELNQLYLATVQTLAAAIDAKDQATHGHIKRVQNYARELAVAIGIKNAGSAEGYPGSGRVA